MPLISVIVPVYKVEPYLGRCVDSILNQTYTDFELILVDDGSPDNCGAICDDYAMKDHRVHVIHQSNGGLSAARNAGIDWVFANSNSQWLSFIDSDDWVHPQMLEALMDAVTQTGLPVSVASFKRVNGEDGASPFDWDSDRTEVWNTETLFVKKNVEATVAWGKLYYKELFHSLRYPVGKIHEDEFLTFRVIFRTEQVAYIPDPMYWYFQNSGGIMSSKSLRSLCDSSGAYEEQAGFYHQSQCMKLRNAAVRRMLTHKYLAVQKAAESCETTDLKQLKADLTRQLKWAKSDLGIRLYGNEYIYESVMPFRAWVSRRWRHLKMWLWKLFSNNGV